MPIKVESMRLMAEECSRICLLRVLTVCRATRMVCTITNQSEQRVRYACRHGMQHRFLSALCDGFQALFDGSQSILVDSDFKIWVVDFKHIEAVVANSSITYTWLQGEKEKRQKSSMEERRRKDNKSSLEERRRKYNKSSLEERRRKDNKSAL
jgi:hypothetical protein